jgi:transcriptional regulator with XRE-family HTH domain
MPTPTRFGARLRQRRRELELTQLKLAELSGLTQAQISELEMGRLTRVMSDKVCDLALHLGVSVGWLLGVTDDAPERITV